jgi:WXG100 family type VII secretion target
MAGAIRITPFELRDASEFLGQRLEAIANEANSLKAKLDDIGEGWEGEARATFFEIFNNEMWPVLNNKLPELIQGIISQLNGTAETMEEADAQIAGSLRG